MTAQFKKVGRDTEAVLIPFKQLGPDGCKGLLGVSFWLNILPQKRSSIWLRQGFFIDFTVGGERPFVYQYQRRGRHIGWQYRL